MQPSKNRAKATPRRPRKGSTKGKAGQQVVRRRQRATKRSPAAPIAAPSLAALTLAPKGGLEVQQRMNGKLAGDAIDNIAVQLMASYIAAEKHLNGVTVKAEPTSGEAATEIGRIVNLFKERCVPLGSPFAVNLHDGAYCFGLPVACEWEEKWHVLEAKKILEVAKSHGPALAALIPPFLKTLVSGINIGTWYNGGMEMAEDWVDERVHNLDDDEDIKVMEEDLHSHRRGAAAECATAITAAETLLPHHILARLSRIRKPHPLKDAIVAACELLSDELRCGDFRNPDLDPDHEEYNDVEGVDFWDQNTVLWEYDNCLTSAWQEWLDSKYQESGVLYPIGIFWMDPRRRDWSDKYRERISSWPSRLAEVFRLFDEACNPAEPVKKVRKSRSSKGALINILV